jgi:hypothetical protein
VRAGSRSCASTGREQASNQGVIRCNALRCRFLPTAPPGLGVVRTVLTHVLRGHTIPLTIPRTRLPEAESVEIKRTDGSTVPASTGRRGRMELAREAARLAP